MSRSTLVPRLFLAVAALFVVCVVLQLFLAGLGVFDGYRNFLTHRDFGYLFGWLAVVMLVLAIVGRLPRRQVLLVVAIIVAFALQSVFVALRADAPVVAALHPLNGVLILLLGLEVTRFAWVTRPASDAARNGAHPGVGVEQAEGRGDVASETAP
jgi:hypothetical protein